MPTRPGRRCIGSRSTLVAVLSVAGTLGLHSLTGDWSFLVPATIGAIGAAAVVEGGRRFGLLVGESLAASVVAFVIVGVVVVGIVPTPGAFADFFEGLTKSWADLLSAVTPTDLKPELRVAPFALAWCGTMLGASLLRWVRQPGVPILGPLDRARHHRAAHRRGPCGVVARRRRDRGRRAGDRAVAAVDRPHRWPRAGRRAIGGGVDVVVAPRTPRRRRRGAGARRRVRRRCSGRSCRSPSRGSGSTYATASFHRGIRWRCRARSCR